MEIALFDQAFHGVDTFAIQRGTIKTMRRVSDFLIQSNFNTRLICKLLKFLSLNKMDKFHFQFLATDFIHMPLLQIIIGHEAAAKAVARTARELQRLKVWGRWS